MSQYCQPSDLTLYAINPNALANTSPTQQTDACIAASAVMDDHFAGRYPLPLLTWPQSVIMYCAWIAQYLLISGARGYNPAAGADVAVRMKYEDAITWCRGVQRQEIHPAVTFNQPNPPTYQLPQVYTSPPRRWE